MKPGLMMQKLDFFFDEKGPGISSKMANLEPKDTSNSFTRQSRIYEACFMLIETHMSDLQAFGKGALSLEDLA